MTGKEKTDDEGFTTVNVKMPKSHWLGMISIAVMAIGGVGWSAHNAEQIKEQEPPVSREWVRKLSTDMDAIGVKLEKLVKHDAEIDGVHKRLDRIEDSLDELKRRN